MACFLSQNESEYIPILQKNVPSIPAFPLKINDFNRITFLGIDEGPIQKLVYESSLPSVGKWAVKFKIV